MVAGMALSISWSLTASLFESGSPSWQTLGTCSMMALCSPTETAGSSTVAAGDSMATCGWESDSGTQAAMGGIEVQLALIWACVIEMADEGCELAMVGAEGTTHAEAGRGSVPCKRP